MRYGDADMLALRVEEGATPGGLGAAGVLSSRLSWISAPVAPNAASHCTRAVRLGRIGNSKRMA